MAGVISSQLGIGPRGIQRSLTLGNNNSVISPSAGPPAYFALGDSHFLGANGNTGGFRQFLTKLGTSTGPFTDATGGRKHAGINGNRLDEMSTRFAANWAGNQAPVILFGGGSNDIAQGASAIQTADRLDTLIDTIVTGAGTSVPLYYVQPATLNTGLDAVITTALRKLQERIAIRRANGIPVYMVDAGRFVTSSLGDLDGLGSGAGEHPIDGVYGPTGVGAGYGKFAYYIDRTWDASRAKDPSQITSVTLEGWYRADDIVLSGSSIDQFNDKSGLNRHMSGTLTRRPTINGSGIFGKPCAVFNGTSNNMTTDESFTISQPYYAFFVVGPSGNTNGTLFESAGSPRCTVFSNGVSGSTFNATTSVTDTDLFPATIGHCYLVHWNGTSTRVWVDGVERRLALSPGSNGQKGFRFGATFANSNYFSGQFYELAIFSGVTVDLAEIFDLHMYAAQRYGIWPSAPQNLTTW